MLKRKMIPVILAAMLALSLTACSSNNDNQANGANDNNSSSSLSANDNQDVKDEVPEEDDTMSEKDYIAKVEELNDFAEDFVEATTEFVTIGTQNPEDIDGMTAAIEKIRDSKQGFLKFGDISNPPAEYVDAHANLSKSTKEFGELVDKYADVLLKAINGEEDPALSTIEGDMNTAVDNLTNDITAIETIYNR